MDDKLTEKVQRWLDTPTSERAIEVGAMLLLQLNRNRILYANIVRHPSRFMGKLEYELRKHLKIRPTHFLMKTECSLRKSAVPWRVFRWPAFSRISIFAPWMEREVVPAVALTLDKGVPAEPSTDEGEQKRYIGRREDHDALPEDIQALYTRNGEVYAKLKETFETLKQMEKAQPCDRYEHLKLLCELDDEYRANWEKYDHYDPSAANNPEDGSQGSGQKVSAARKYISANKEKLASFIEAGDEEKAAALRAKIQDRIAIILADGGDFDASYKESLGELGLAFD